MKPKSRTESIGASKATGNGNMQTYAVTITGRNPLLMHHDNIEWADEMAEWRTVPENRKGSKAGDDRSPAWRWLGALYHDGERIGIPAANVMRAIMEGGALVPVPGGRSGKTFRSQTQSGMQSVEPFWPLRIDDEEIRWADIAPLAGESKFITQKNRVRDLGFGLLVKRAKIGATKHVRVRPMFAPGWTISGALLVWDEQIDARALQTILAYAGQYKGLGDWRPGSRTPGPYGTFEVELSAA